MREISSESFAKKIAWPIEDVFEYALCDYFNEKAEEFGFEPISDDDFHETYMQHGRYGELRDIALEVMWAAGMDIRPDRDDWN